MWDFGLLLGGGNNNLKVKCVYGVRREGQVHEEGGKHSDTGHPTIQRQWQVSWSGGGVVDTIEMVRGNFTCHHHHLDTSSMTYGCVELSVEMR